MPDLLLITHIAPDIYQVRLPLPFALRIVNVYLLRGPAGWTIIDTGINTAEGRAAWGEVFTELGIAPHQIEKIVLTHVHPDHFGLAGWLHTLAAEAGHNVPIFVSPLEDEQARILWREGDTAAQFDQWLMANGMPDDFAATVAGRMGDTRAMTLPHPPPMTHLLPDSEITLGERTFQAMHAPGHSDGQLIFYDAADKLLLSGDHVLMKITPNIGLWQHSQPNPLGRFMTSLRALRNLDVRLALPGHRHNIEDWPGRIDELIGHHEARLGHVLDALAAGQHTPYAIAGFIFPTERFSPHEWRFAIAETLAHLAYLEQQAQVAQADGQFTQA
jgi:glyoxylase-like metal-dependent hydrolase (beta-lactamase superfamily II)